MHFFKFFYLFLHLFLLIYLLKLHFQQQLHSLFNYAGLFIQIILHINQLKILIKKILPYNGVSVVYGFFLATFNKILKYLPDYDLYLSFYIELRLL